LNAEVEASALVTLGHPAELRVLLEKTRNLQRTKEAGLDRQSMGIQ